MSPRGDIFVGASFSLLYRFCRIVGFKCKKVSRESYVVISERTGEEIAGTDPGVKQNHRHFGRDRYRIGRLFSLSYLYYAEKYQGSCAG